MGKNPGSYFQNFWGLKLLTFFAALWIRNLFDPGSGMVKFRPGSATLDLILDNANKKAVDPDNSSVYPSFVKHGHSGWTAFLMVSTTP
jgi:hypothetical protein